MNLNESELFQNFNSKADVKWQMWSGTSFRDV